MATAPVNIDEYAFPISNLDIPSGVDLETHIYNTIVAQMAQPHGSRLWPIPVLPSSSFNFPGIDGLPLRGDALPLDLPDSGFLVVSQGFPELRVRTVVFPGVDAHPINGSREWGVEQVGPDTYRVYTRAAAKDDTRVGAFAREQGLEERFWRELMRGVATDLASGTPPSVEDWTLPVYTPTPPGLGDGS